MLTNCFNHFKNNRFTNITNNARLYVKTNANLTGVVTSFGNATSIASGAITSDMIGTLNKSKVGLDLVNNTSDASKPISDLTQAALGNKLNTADNYCGVSLINSIN